MTLAEMLQAIEQGATAESLESEQVEFKEQDPNLKRCFEIVADAVVCLANANGGKVVLGVRDDVSGLDAIVGVTDELTRDVLVKAVFDRTRPALSVPVETVEFQGRRLLVATAPRGAALYSNVKGTATRRVGRECRPFPPEEQRKALASRGLYDWSSQPSPVGLEAADSNELVRVRRLLGQASRGDLAGADDSQLLRDLGLLRDGHLTWAGVLLVGTPTILAAHAPQHEYAYQYRLSPGSESSARVRERRPILAAVEQLMDAIETRRTVHSLNVAGGVQLQLHDYPSGAARELVVNAFVHRDFEVQGSVDIEHSPESLTINSPGALVFGVTPNNILTHPSTPRNRLLLDVVTLLQVAERTGQGVDRAYREMLRIGKPPPTYEDHESRVVATLAGGVGNDAFVRFITSRLEDRDAADVNVLLVLEMFCGARSLNAERVADRIQRSTADAQAVLRRLVELHLIAPTRRTSRHVFPNYSLTGEALAALGRAVTYHRPSLDERDTKVTDHVSEYGFITNQTLRRMFDITVYQARDLLRDLQNRGVLIKLDDRTGGRGVRYGPGPSL